MKTVILFFILILAGCSISAKKPENPIFIKCKLPEIPQEEYQVIPDNSSFPEKLQIILNNCLKLKRENELLREAIKLCQ